MNRDRVVRIGLIGAARAAPQGILAPARRIPGVRIEAIASRSVQTADAFARKHAIPRALGSYNALLDDDSIDAVYIALPTGLHSTWALRALERGKHVLCEKPLAVNASQARLMASAASKRNLVLQEALQFLYLPTLRRQREIACSGVLGRIRKLVSIFRHPGVPMAAHDFRLDFALGGGSGLDLGCYAVACMLEVAREEPEVLTSTAECVSPNVDRWMRSTVKFPSGATGIVECGFRGAYTPSFGLSVECEEGTITWGPRGVIYTKNGEMIREDVPSVVPYDTQLHAFLSRVRGEPSDAPPPERAIAAARVLDAMYERAGLAPRAVSHAA